MRILLVFTVGLANLVTAPLYGQARAYYPTQPGDTWTYESTVRGRFTNEVVDSVVTPGAVRFRIRSTDESGREQFIVARYEGSRLYIGPDGGTQSLIGDFGLEPGASATVESGSQRTTVTVRAHHESLDMFGTTFDDVVEMRVGAAETVSTTYFFARDVGLVRVSSANFVMDVRLVSATVGGEAVSALDAVVNRQVSPEAVRYLTAALDSMQRHSVRRDSVDWPQLRERALGRASSAQTIAETYPAIAGALRELGDNHSFFMAPQSVASWQRSGTTENPVPDARRLSSDVGYVMLPQYAGGDRAEIDRYAAQLHRDIARIDSPPICGWIVDLRQNSGGNMWPMLAGIGPILGEGVAGMFVDPAGNQTEWSYAGGAARTGTHTLADAGGSTYSPPAGDRPVAVLTGSRTASSGEAIAVSFRGRPGTRTFGQPTRGLSTSNRGVRLSDGASILLTTAVFADREGVRYGGSLEPDEVAEASAGAGTEEQDLVISTAKSWLLSQPACVARP